jgi:hypothetical protein
MNRSAAFLKIMFTVVFLFLLQGCSNTESENVKTSGFYATYTLTAEGTSTATCQATFQVGGSTGTYLDLNSGDSVTCAGQSMSRGEFLGMITYTATVNAVAGQAYDIVLNRSGESPYTSTVVLPSAVSGNNPSTTTSYQKGSAVTASWTPSTNTTEDMMSVTLYYEAGSESASPSYDDTAPESGTMVFGSSDTNRFPSVTGTYSGKVKFKRTRNGVLAPGLEGRIYSTQSKEVVIQMID